MAVGQRESHHDSLPHDHDPAHGHSHTHGVVDPAVFTTQRGIWAVKWSFFSLLATALFQAAICLISGSVALLADTIHNLGDAATALPLWAAFALARWKPGRRFTYGYGRLEDLAGVVVVFTIFASAVVVGTTALERFLHPQPVEHLGAVIVAALIGCLGNEAVAIFRIRVGREIGSAALVADGYHARADGLTSLSVLVGAGGVGLGYPLADPAVGVLIMLVILCSVWQSGKTVFTRLLDGVDAEVVDEIRHAASHAPGVHEVTEVRVRWLGHRLHAEVNVAVDSDLSVEQGHEIANEARHQLLHHLRYLSNATVHVDPLSASGEDHHRIANHTHGDWPAHSHPG